MTHRRSDPPPFWRHPAGQIFALAGVWAVLLPWAGLIPVEDPRLMHLRLGLFGFGGTAITGYILTALPAWTKHSVPASASAVCLALILARLTQLLMPDVPLASLVPQMVVGAVVLWPVLAAKLWTRAPLTAVPLMLGLAEAMIVRYGMPVHVLLYALLMLILLVGGRAVSAFLYSEALREGRIISRPGPVWVTAVFAGTALLCPTLAPYASPVCSVLILWRAFPALWAGAANRMLSLAWSTLAFSLPALVLTPASMELTAAEHVFLAGTMGCTIFAFAARAAMRRQDGGTRLVPRNAQSCGFIIVVVSSLIRVGALYMPWPDAWLLVSGLCWSLGWILFLVSHLMAFPHPAPFPLLSGVRG